MPYVALRTFTRDPLAILDRTTSGRVAFVYLRHRGRIFSVLTISRFDPEIEAGTIATSIRGRDLKATPIRLSNIVRKGFVLRVVHKGIEYIVEQGSGEHRLAQKRLGLSAAVYKQHLGQIQSGAPLAPSSRSIIRREPDVSPTALTRVMQLAARAAEDLSIAENVSGFNYVTK